jgi:hypothetical protein
MIMQIVPTKSTSMDSLFSSCFWYPNKGKYLKKFQNFNRNIRMHLLLSVKKEHALAFAPFFLKVWVPLAYMGFHGRSHHEWEYLCIMV